MLPNVFIPGAQKSGTTTLCSALDHHPEVIVSTPKEPAFFSRAANLSRPEMYQECFRAKNGITPRAIIDGSNAYMVDPLAPIRIRNMLGKDLRFIFCLREPVARMVSGFWHQVKKGRERRPLSEALFFVSASLDEAMREEDQRLRDAATQGLIDVEDCEERFDEPMWNFRYLRNSLYAADLARYHLTFGRARVKVILFDELVANPVATLSSVAMFLGLDPTGLPADVGLHRNATLLARAPFLLRALRQLPRRGFLRQMPNYEAIRGTLLYRRPPQADPGVLARLRLLVAPEVVRLQTMLNQDLAALWDTNRGVQGARSAINDT
jgi:hypothetical protein